MRLLYFGVFLLLFCKVQSQKVDSLEILQANELYKKGRKHLYKNLDSTCFYFKQSYQIFKEQKDWLNAVQVLKGISFGSSYHYDLEMFRGALFSVDSILEFRSFYFDSLNVNRSLLSRNFLEKTTYYSKIKNFEKTRLNGLRVIEIIERLPDSLQSIGDIKILSSAYEYVAGSYKHEGEYAKAEELYKKSLRIILKHLDEDFALPTYRLIGDLYRKKGEYALSNTYLNKKLDQEILKGTSSKNRIVKSCFAIADNHIQLLHQDSARYYLDIAKQQLLDKDPLQFQYYEMLGKTDLSVNNLKEAIVAFDKAIALLLEENSGFKNVETARLFSLKAQALDRSSQDTEALQNYQMAISKLVPGFEHKQLVDNPEPGIVQNKYEYLKILIKKAATLQKTGDKNGTLKTALMAIKTMDALIPTFENKEDKQFLINTFYPIFEIGLSSAFQLYEDTSDTSYIDTAFLLFEKSKSTILLEAVLNSRAYRFSNIPESLLEKERQLKASINYLQKRVARKKNKQLFEDRLLVAKEDYSNLIDQLEKGYPSYYNLKYNNEVIGLNDFQLMLESDSMAISYFVGEGTIYMIGVSNSEKKFVEITKTNVFDQQILELYDQLTTPTSDLSAVNETSQQIYTEVLKPILNSNQYDNLIVIPDGKLHYIPFESLHDGDNYILQNYTIGYANSATLLTQLKDHKITNKDFLGFAPSFSEKYSPLGSSDTEVERIKTLFDGEVYLGIQATTDVFKKKSPLSSILHLATHAIIDDQIPENSHLVFSPDSQEEILNIGDIYALPINASLVALSACETGIGSLKKGEGMISLSRAFFYAGAASIASTKWQINDRSTSDIMQDFYGGLAKGKNKDEALRLAKLSFLEKNYDNNYKHPYYWSGLIITGSTAAVSQSTPLWIWISIATLLVLAIVFWRVKKSIHSF